MTRTIYTPDPDGEVTQSQKSLADVAAALNDSIAKAESRLHENLNVVEVAVSSAEVLALNTTPKVLVPAPGAGYVLEMRSALFILDYESAAYATNGDLTIRETDGVGTILSDTVALADFLAQSADTVRRVPALGSDVALSPNSPLVLSCATGDPVTGDSPLRIRVAYAIHPTGL